MRRLLGVPGALALSSSDWLEDNLRLMLAAGLLLLTVIDPSDIRPDLLRVRDAAVRCWRLCVAEGPHRPPGALSTFRQAVRLIDRGLAGEVVPADEMDDVVYGLRNLGEYRQQVQGVDSRSAERAFAIATLRRWANQPMTRPPRGRLTVGQVIRIRREALGWSQQQLADKVGVNRRSVVRWEGDQDPPSRAHCQKLADVLDGLPTDYEEM